MGKTSYKGHSKIAGKNYTFEHCYHLHMFTMKL